MLFRSIPGFEASGWQGYFVPAHTPREIVARIAQETAKVLATRDVADRLRAMGNEPVGSTPEAFEARFKAEVERFATIVKEARIPLQN